MAAIITDDTIVQMHFTLKTAEGEQLDSSIGDVTLHYMHGHGHIVPGLEAALTGAALGSTHSVVVAPADGYGEASGLEPQQVPREAFPPNARLEEGMQFGTRSEEGDIIPLWVVSTDDEFVTVTTEHPLAGVELHFDVSIVNIREATSDEISNGRIASNCSCC